MKKRPSIYVALPAMDELDYLPGLLDCIRSQTYEDFRVYVCVNQPDAWWGRTDKLELCIRNSASLEYLAGIPDLPLTVLDRSSRGRGWSEKKSGVGHARRLLMDTIAAESENDDIILSLDADTTFGPGYFKAVADGFRSNPEARALAVPYYHRLTGDGVKDRAILRYEIYMRHYSINLWRIRSPYSFTAIGSAIALPVRSYKAVGGITPHSSGEDFYFMQKLRKYGPVLTWIDGKIFPAARYSDRVGFGTGPAMIKGSRGDWDSYPIYPAEAFDAVRESCELFPALYQSHVPVPVERFLAEKFGEKDIWGPLRENCSTMEQFIRACHIKMDALRLLQYLKWNGAGEKETDEERLFRFLQVHHPDLYGNLSFKPGGFSFDKSPVAWLDELRDGLARIEEAYQRTNLLTPGFIA